jgi:glycosyltransferase involved in cell wall biosynthesis
MATIALLHADDSFDGRRTSRMFRRPVFQLAEDLSALGHDVRTISIPASGRTDRTPFGVADPSAAHLVPADLHALFHRRRFDVVHAIGNRAGRVLEECVPHATWVWSSEVGGHSWWPRSARLAIVPTENDLARLRRAGAPLSRTRVIPERLSAPATADHVPVNARATSAVTVLDDPSAVADAVRALSLLPGLRLTILADRTGEDRWAARPIELLAHRFGVEKRLRWWRPTDSDEARRAVSEADVLLALSRNCFDPAVVSAAMALGTPVVIAEGGGGQEFARAGSTAVIVRTGSARRIATVLQIVLQDEQTRSEVAEAARRLARDVLHPATTSVGLVAAYAEVFDGVEPRPARALRPAGSRRYLSARRTVVA